jgi:hypothetical protein
VNGRDDGDDSIDARMVFGIMALLGERFYVLDLPSIALAVFYVGRLGRLAFRLVA